MGFLMLTLADFSSFAWNFVPGTLCTHIPVYSHHKTATNAPYNSKTPLPQCGAYKPPPPTPNISPLNSLPTNRTWMENFSGLCRGGDKQGYFHQFHGARYHKAFHCHHTLSGMIIITSELKNVTIGQKHDKWKKSWKKNVMAPSITF